MKPRVPERFFQFNNLALLQGRFKSSFHGQQHGPGREQGRQQAGSRKPARGGKPWILPPTLPGGFGSSPLPAHCGGAAKKMKGQEERRNARRGPRGLLPASEAVTGAAGLGHQRPGWRWWCVRVEPQSPSAPQRSERGAPNSAGTQRPEVRPRLPGEAPPLGFWRRHISVVRRTPRTRPRKNPTYRACTPPQKQQNAFKNK